MAHLKTTLLSMGRGWGICWFSGPGSDIVVKWVIVVVVKNWQVFEKGSHHFFASQYLPRHVCMVSCVSLK